MSRCVATETEIIIYPCTYDAITVGYVNSTKFMLLWLLSLACTVIFFTHLSFCISIATGCVTAARPAPLL